MDMPSQKCVQVRGFYQLLIFLGDPGNGKRLGRSTIRPTSIVLPDDTVSSSPVGEIPMMLILVAKFSAFLEYKNIKTKT